MMSSNFIGIAMQIDSLKDISYRDSSFGLVRTNPLITGNIKFTVDSKNGLWLNTIDANTILAQDMFKRFPINTTRSYPSNVKTFFNQKNISTDVIYEVYKEIDPTKVSHDYKDQYDFFYFAGAKYLNSIQYDERFTYFAPLYVNNCDVPEYFIIFKIPGALNHNIEEMASNPDFYEKKTYLFDMMKNASIIKTYSMKVGTQLGDYLRNKVFKDSLFPTEPLNVNFNKDCQTTWYGLNIKSGVYSGAGEYLYDYYIAEHTLKDFEYYITCGFKRNGLLYPNILNMEFLFDDDTSELFDHNRYFGMYVNSADIARFGIDVERLVDKQDEYGNYPKIPNRIDEFSKKNIVINNNDGCKVEGSLVDIDKYDMDSLDMKDGVTKVAYIKDKFDNLHSIQADDEDNNIKKINFIEKRINVKDFAGSDLVVDISGNGFVPLSNGRSAVTFSLSKNTVLHDGDELRIYYSGGSRVDHDNNDMRYDSIFFTSGLVYDDNVSPALKRYGKLGEYYSDIQNYDLISLDNEFRGDYMGTFDFGRELKEDCDFIKLNDYYYIDSVSDDFVGLTICNENGGYVTIAYPKQAKRYIGYGIQKRKMRTDTVPKLYLIENIDTIKDNLTNYYCVGMSGIKFDLDRFMTALVNCINEFPLKPFATFYNNGDLILVMNSENSHDGDIAIKFITDGTEYGYIGNIDENGFIWSSGATEMNNILLVPNDFEERIMDNFNSVNDYLVRSESGYSKIKNVIHYSSYFDRGQDRSEMIKAHDIYKNYIGLVLEKNEHPVIAASKFEITKVFRPSFGLCSFYKVKDFDFDYHSDEYAKVPTGEYRSKFFVNEGESIDNDVLYVVVSDNDGSVTFNSGVDGVEHVTFSTGEFCVRGMESDYNNYYTSNNGAFLVPIGKIIDKEQRNDIIKDGGNVGIEVSDINKTIEGFDIVCNDNLYNMQDYSVRHKINDFYGERIFNVENFQILIAGDGNNYFVMFSRKNSSIPFDFTDSERLEYINYLTKLCNEEGEQAVLNWKNMFLDKPYIIPYPILDDSNDYLSFEGFQSISSSDDNSYDKTKPSWVFRDRFLSKTGLCEYDYNHENDNPEYAFFSATTGVSCKFMYMNGTDIHNNPYRLNTSSVFGKYNMSPSIKNYDIDPSVFSNEWFYIVNNLKTEYSIGSKMFDWNEMNGEITLCDDFEMSSLIEHDVDSGITVYKYADIKYSSSAKQCQAFFRGQLLKFDETDENGVVIDKSKKYDGYKFTAVLQVFPEKYDDMGRCLKPPFEYVLRTDDKKKLIVFGIILYIGEWVDSKYYYTNPNEYNIDLEVYNKMLDGHSGDYRFSVNDGYIDNISYSDLYMLSSKKYCTDENSYSHINVSAPSKFTFLSESIDRIDDLYNIPGYKEYLDSFGYIPEMSENYNSGALSFRPNKGKYIERVGIFHYNETDGTATLGGTIKSVSDANIMLEGDIKMFTQTSDNIVKADKIMYDIRELFGGSNYYKRIFKYTTLCGIRDLFELGTFVQNDNSYMKMSFLDDSVIDKKTYLEDVPITDGSVIGYSNIERNLVIPYQIRRMQGQYIPVFKDVFYFTSENNVVNCRFDTDVDKFSEVRNFGIMKISDSGSRIFEYENSTQRNLEYPYIDECTVDYVDMGMMLTSWDAGFHRKYTSKTESEPVYGTMRREEDDTYLNNLILLPKSIELSQFDVDIVDDIFGIDPNEYQVAYNKDFTKKSIVDGFISVEDVAINWLMERNFGKDGEKLNIRKSFDDIKADTPEKQKEYTESTLDDYIRSYIRINILPLYEIKSVTSYSRINNKVKIFSVSDEDCNNPSVVNNIRLCRDVKINKTGDKFKVDFAFPVKYDRNTELFFSVKLTLI